MQFIKGLQGARKKNNPLGKLVISVIVADFSTKLQHLQMRIQAIYPANFIKNNSRVSIDTTV